MGKEDFCPQHTFECGQFFAYKKIEGNYQIFSNDKQAIVQETVNGFEVLTEDAPFFEEFLDLKTDYSKIKKVLSEHKILQEPIKFGHGIRILKQPIFETLISFILSANNNIKRFTQSLFKMREKFGKNMGSFYAFPTCEELKVASEQDFVELGAGYRAKYLYSVVRQIDEKMLESWKNLPTNELRKKLIELSGVGPKVADCVLLFGYSRGDVFPVDTWIAQMYEKYYTDKLENREKIREKLTIEFDALSGYAQQYLFYYMRSVK